MKNYVKCDRCFELVFKDSTYEIGDETICEACYEENKYDEYYGDSL
jgi:formylmethanofuran dehydrogenase subunit E